MRRWTLALVAILALGGCGPEEWISYAYPDRGDLSEVVVVGVVESEEECEDVAVEYLSRIGAQMSGDWECEGPE